MIPHVWPPARLLASFGDDPTVYELHRAKPGAQIQPHEVDVYTAHLSEGWRWHVAEAVTDFCTDTARPGVYRVSKAVDGDHLKADEPSLIMVFDLSPEELLARAQRSGPSTELPVASGSSSLGGAGHGRELGHPGEQLLSGEHEHRPTDGPRRI